MSDDHFAEFDESTTSSEYKSTSPELNKRDIQGEKKFSKEVFSEKVSAKYRTFFVDVKENENGHLVKISEKSRGGQKSTIMMDQEDLPEIIKALQNAQVHCAQE